MIGPSSTLCIVGLLTLACAGPAIAQSPGSTQPNPGPTPSADVIPVPAPDSALHDPITWIAAGLSIAALAILWWTKALGPGCLGKHGLRDLQSHSWLSWFVAAFVSYLAPAIGSGLVIVALGAPDKSTRFQAISGLAGYGIGLTIAIVMACLIHRSTPNAGFRIRPKHLSLGLVSFLLCIPIVQTASSISTEVYQRVTGTPISNHVAHETLETIIQNPTDHWVWVMMFLAVVAAPIQEEIVYRGFLQSGILKATRRPWLSITTTSGIFALAHLQANVPWYAISTLFVLALALGFAFERSRSIAVPIVMHMLFNAANIVVALFIS